MKECPKCGSFSQDMDAVCGVCNGNLGEVKPLDVSIQSAHAKDVLNEESITRHNELHEKKQQFKKAVIKALLLMIAGAGVVTLSAVTFPFGNGNPRVYVLSFFAFAIGVFTIAAGLGGLGKSRRYYWHHTGPSESIGAFQFGRHGWLRFGGTTFSEMEKEKLEKEKNMD